MLHNYVYTKVIRAVFEYFQILRDDSNIHRFPVCDVVGKGQLPFQKSWNIRIIPK